MSRTDCLGRDILINWHQGEFVSVPCVSDLLSTSTTSAPTVQEEVVSHKVNEDMPGWLGVVGYGAMQRSEHF